MNLIFQLITNVADSQKLSRDLLIVIQMRDCYHLLVPVFLTLLTDKILPKTTLIFPKKFINKQG